MQNSLELMLIHFSASRLGAVVLNLNTNLSADELSLQLRSTGCSVLIADAIFESVAISALSEVPELSERTVKVCEIQSLYLPERTAVQQSVRSYRRAPTVG